MKVLSLTLEGYKRIQLNDIRRLKITVTEAVQIILGTNGSGKSSILNELSPLPGMPSDFHKGGMKEIELVHNGQYYKLVSDYTGKPGEHYFYKGDVNLNDGRTITVQRKLVEQEFQYTDDIHKLLLGKTKFTLLSPGKRRELISLMSDTDMTYAFSLFKKVAGIARDHQGTVKHLKGRLIDEVEKLRSMETDRESLKTEVEQLQRELTLLMRESRTDLPSSRQVEERINQYQRELSQLSEQVLTETPPGDLSQYNSHQDIEVELQSAQHHRHATVQLLEHQTEEHSRIRKAMGNLNVDDLPTLDGLTQRVNDLKERVVYLSQQRGEFQFDGDVSDLVAQGPSIQQTMNDILSHLPDNSERQFSRAMLDKTEQAIEVAQRNVDQAKAKLARCEHDIHHIEQARDTQCPQCGYVWIEGVSEGDLDHLKTKRAELEKLVTENTQRHQSLYAEREKIRDYSQQFGRLREIAHSYPKAQNLISWLMEDDRILHQPSQYTTAVGRWLHDLKIDNDLWHAQQDLRRSENTLKQLQDLETHGGTQITDQLDRLDESLSKLTADLQTTDLEIKQLSRLLTYVNERRTQEQQLNATLDRLCADQSLYINALRSETMDELIRQHQTDLAMRTQRMNQTSSQEALIQDLEKSLASVEQQHQHYRLLAKALSPNEGLIAHHLTAFIEAMTDQVNAILRQLYVYPLVVKPCGVESNDLDYKFPMLAGVDRDPVKDVSEGSDGQMEVIDFAFRLVAVAYLGYNDYPLFLDELGHHQDEQHTSNAMRYVKTMVESGHYSQIFMISHDAVASGQFPHAEVTVLSSTNITVPCRYNDHVEIA